jgi:Ankyrin repeats (3 copies)
MRSTWQLPLLFFAILGLTVGLSGCKAVGPEPTYAIHSTADQSASFGMYIPKDLDDAFIELQKMLDPRFLAEFRSGTEKELARYHFGLGMWMRNNWGLWKASRLADYFERLDIHHPDDMSAIIMTSLHRHLNGKPIKLDEQVGYYQAYWNSPTVKKMIQDAEEARLKKQAEQDTRTKATPEELLLIAAQGRELTLMQQLLDQGVSPNTVNPDGMSVLAHMAGWGEADMVRLLLERGAHVNATSASGRTALMAAAFSGQAAAVRTLLDRGADANITSLDGRTALMFAAQEGDAEVVRALMDHQADVRVRATDGWTALMFAASYGNNEALQMLVAQSDLNAVTPDGMTALKAAIAAGRVKETELLKRAGAKR